MCDKQTQLRAEYQFRINRVFDYIEVNLERNLTLSELAEVAMFSPYHFHRLFRAMVGETPNQFVQRVRLEKAAALLLNNLARSVTEVALDCGFSSSATFARAFRDQFGLSASEWRAGKGQIKRKNCKVDSKQGQMLRNWRKEYDIVALYSRDTFNHLLWRLTMKSGYQGDLKFDVEVKELSDMTVAYVRHVGPYKGDSELFGRLFGQLYTWAGPRGLMGRPGSKLMSVYHDSPEITDDSKLRLSICMTVPEDTPVDGEIGKMIINSGTYAVGHFTINVDQYEDAWNALMGAWLPESGYQPADGLCFEDYLNDPKTHPEGKHIVDIHIPVKPL
ncbi:family transcriptional regulator [Leptolyngbya sp. Heron Island J]|uniref:AraC family transcriptional regulator n=1 Tax=Leptolyngbya sp. Heron Island J TaxID=1385935 RepID=UPI0003B9B84A|nr:AraC family transcriptional regulator [Leptolyngbya sp. Heron Island J]ESA33620.1 family transcriptional regulator [Leptolyngbya sp. Heron Island J]